MKRISVLVVVLSLSTANIVEGYHHYVPPRYLVHYSPYAFSYNNSGLVGGGVTYSPYALSYNRPGLVSEDMSYSPYAFSYRHSGLIDSYSGYSNPGCSFYSWPIPIFVLHTEKINTSLSRFRLAEADEMKSFVMSPKAQSCNEAARQVTARQLHESRKALQETKKQDAGEIIRAYLISKNVNDFQTDHLFRIDNRTISVDFVLRQKNLIIKYWNSEAIQALENGQEYKKNYYENYKKDWQDSWVKYLLAGTKVYQVRASDREGIIKALDGELETQL